MPFTLHRQAPRSARPLARLVASGLLLAAMSAQAAFDQNLIVNPGADAAAGGDGSFLNNLPGWTVAGELTAIDYSLGCPGGYPCLSDPGPAVRGANHFAGGNAGLSSGRQTIDLGFAASAIGGAGAHYRLSGWLGGYASQNDNARLSVNFLNAASQVIGTSTIGPVSAADRGAATALLQREQAGWVPQGAVSAQVELLMTRTGGSSNDGYADTLGLTLAEANLALTAPGSARPGQTIDVTVAANGPFAGIYSGDALLAFGFDVGYDTSLLRLDHVTVAAGWDDISAQLPGTDVAGSVFPGLADAGQPTLQLATLSFQVLAQGLALIDVHSSAADDLNEGLTYAGGPSVDLFGRAQISLVPEPASWLLLALGAGVLGLRRRLGQGAC